jgi:hypothetical protein
MKGDHLLRAWRGQQEVQYFRLYTQ